MVGFDSTDRVTTGLSVAAADSEEDAPSRSEECNPASRTIKERSITFAFCAAMAAWALFSSGSVLCTSFQLGGNYKFGFWRRQNENGICIPFNAPDDQMFFAGQVASIVGVSLGGIFVVTLILILRRYISSSATTCRCVGAVMIICMSSTVVSTALPLRAEFCNGNCNFTMHAILLYVAAMLWIAAGVTLFSVHDFVENAKTHTAGRGASATTSKSTKSSHGGGISVIESLEGGQPSVYDGSQSPEPFRAPLANKTPYDKQKELTDEMCLKRRQRMHELTQEILDGVPENRVRQEVKAEEREEESSGTSEPVVECVRDDVGIGNNEFFDNMGPRNHMAQLIVEAGDRQIGDHGEFVRPELLPFISLSVAESTVPEQDSSSSQESSPPVLGATRRCPILYNISSCSAEDEASVPRMIAFED